MKLYYAPGACSLAVHIVTKELGIPVEAVKVDLKAKKTADGGDYLKVNSKGYVPALQLDDGTLITEGPAITQYLADSKPDSKLAPKAGTIDRVRLQEWLNFISSEMHKGVGNFFNPALTEEWKKAVSDRLAVRFAWLDEQLKGKQYLMGDQFSVADPYLFTILNWTFAKQFDISRWPNVVEYHKLVGARAKVQETMKAEGLVK
jgi:glutathione S-transferase